MRLSNSGTRAHNQIRARINRIRYQHLTPNETMLAFAHEIGIQGTDAETCLATYHTRLNGADITTYADAKHATLSKAFGADGVRFALAVLVWDVNTWPQYRQWITQG